MMEAQEANFSESASRRAGELMMMMERGMREAYGHGTDIRTRGEGIVTGQVV